jgi:hypothetical protein
MQHFLQWAPAQRTEPAFRPAHPHQCERIHIVGDAKERLEFRFDPQVVGGDDRAETERAAGPV